MKTSKGDSMCTIDGDSEKAMTMSMSPCHLTKIGQPYQHSALQYRREIYFYEMKASSISHPLPS